LFVVLSLFDVSAWQAEARWERDGRWPSALNMATNMLAGSFFQVYWLVVAVWPALA